MKPVPESPLDALEIFCSPDAEEWERDYAAMMITALDEALPHLAATARDPNASPALQQRVAECLANAWRDRGMLFTANIEGFTPVARKEVLFQRGEGPP